MNHSRTFRTVFAFLPFLFLVIGCAPLGGAAIGRHKLQLGTSIDLAKLSQIKIGEATRAEVEQTLGQPLAEMRSELSQEVSLEYFSQLPATSGSVEKKVGDAVLVHDAVQQAVQVGKAASGQLVRFAPGVAPAVLVGMMVGEFCIPRHYSWESHSVNLKFNADGKLIEIGTRDLPGASEGTVFSTRMSLGEKIDLAKVDQIQEGKSTAADVEDLLGPPTFVTKTLQEVEWGYISGESQVGLVKAGGGKRSPLK